MGGTFERAQRLRAARAEQIDRAKRISNLLTVGVLAVLAIGITVVGAVELSPLGLLGGVWALAAPWAWLRGDAARVDEIDPRHRQAYAAEIGWSALAVACLAGGYALFITAMVNGW